LSRRSKKKKKKNTGKLFFTLGVLCLVSFLAGYILSVINYWGAF